MNRLFGVILLVLISSCKEDFLELQDPNSITSGNFFATQDDFVLAVNTLYGEFNSIWDGANNASNLRSDGVALAAVDFAQFAQYSGFTNDPTNGLSDGFWNGAYTVIFRANTILQQMESFEFTDPEFEATMNAELHFFRGAAYFRIAHAFGDAPITLVPAETEEQFNTEPSPAAAVWQQAIDDLTIAKAGLPEEQDEVGRATWGAATAFLGKLYLYRAGYLNDNASYALASAEFREIMTSGLYGLVPDWNDNFLASTENNEESIYEAQLDVFSGSYNATQERPFTASVPGISGEIVSKPSEWIFTEMSRERDNDGEFDVRLLNTLFFEGGLPLFGVEFADLGDGLVCTGGGGDDGDGGEGGLECWEEDLTGEDGFWVDTVEELYPEAEIVSVMLMGCWDPVAEEEYENITVSLSIGCNLVFDSFEEELTGNGCEASSDGGNFDGWFRKYLSVDEACPPETPVNNERIIRYADILLMFAEAEVMGTGSLTDAIDAVNEIRDRANLPTGVDANGDALSAANIMAEIEHQRVMEFVMEGTRYYDLIRWGVLQERLQLHGFPDGSSNVTEKHQVFPIPIGEVLSNELLDQNPLWQ